MHTDEFFMKEALKEAEIGGLKKEVPVGAVLVCDNKIISKGHNLVEIMNDVTYHAEIICLRRASKYFNDWRLSESTLYCTLEPCSMCAGAILLARVKRLVWGTNAIRLGANGSYVDIFNRYPLWKVEIKKYILQKESERVLKKFFKNIRK